MIVINQHWARLSNQYSNWKSIPLFANSYKQKLFNKKKKKKNSNLHLAIVYIKETTKLN